MEKNIKLLSVLPIITLLAPSTHLGAAQKTLTAQIKNEKHLVIPKTWGPTDFVLKKFGQHPYLGTSLFVFGGIAAIGATIYGISKIQKLKQELATQAKDNGTTQLQEQNTSIKNLEKQLQAVNNSNTELTQENTKLNSELGALKKEHNNVQTEKKQLENTNKELKEYIKNFQEEVKNNADQLQQEFKQDIKKVIEETREQCFPHNDPNNSFLYKEEETHEDENNELSGTNNLFTLDDNDFNQLLNTPNETSTSTTKQTSNSFFFPEENNDNKQNKQLFEFNYSSNSTQEEETGENDNFNQWLKKPSKTPSSATEHPSNSFFFPEEINDNEKKETDEDEDNELFNTNQVLNQSGNTHYDNIINQLKECKQESLQTLENLKQGLPTKQPAPQPKNIVGLKNNNNLCYRNAVLQVLKHAGLQTPMSDRITSWQTEELKTFFDNNSQEVLDVSKKMPKLHTALNNYFGEKEQQSPVELFEKLMNKESILKESCERFTVFPEYSFDKISNLDKTYAIIDISQPTKNIVTKGIKETVLDFDNLIQIPAQIENHKLIAVIYRFGATDSGGHIISFVNKQGTWYVCDDKNVQQYQGTLPNKYKSQRGTACPIMALYEKSL